MSTLECNRNGCGSIMCDHYSYRYGYICNDCKQELKKLLSSDGAVSIEGFMSSPKPKDDDMVYTDVEIDNIFKER